MVLTWKLNNLHKSEWIVWQCEKCEVLVGIFCLHFSNVIKQHAHQIGQGFRSSSFNIKIWDWLQHNALSSRNVWAEFLKFYDSQNERDKINWDSILFRLDGNGAHELELDFRYFWLFLPSFGFTFSTEWGVWWMEESAQFGFPFSIWSLVYLICC